MSGPGPTAIRRLIAFGVAAHGLFLLATSLVGQLNIRGRVPHLHVGGLFEIPILFGLSLLYLSALLLRGKRTAWSVAVILYAVIFLFNLLQVALLLEVRHGNFSPEALPMLVLPLVIMGGLFLCQSEFRVKSDLRSFGVSLRFIIAILLVAFLYGVTGFLLLDKRDFRQEISVTSAMHYTIDQFGLTTDHALVPYTRRAHVFQASLSVISVGAAAYAALSLFQPLRARFIDQSSNRREAERLLKHYHGNSEDFFKLWPHDKAYFFAANRTAGVAYSVHRGVALVVGDPFGNKEEYGRLLTDFSELCRINDWAVACIHTDPAYTELYKQCGFSLQKIGEEAVLEVAHFQDSVRTNKYFRHIYNRFTKQGFTTEMLPPPHDTTTIRRLQTISKAWLNQPGRAERRFMMGYFTPQYMQECPVFVLRDPDHKIVAFMNQVHSYDPKEANFDLLRHTQTSLGNSNDFLLMEFIGYMQSHGFERVNLGLCPLAGLDDRDDERSVVDSALHFVYANGDRFYSFSGLQRFKAKYDPAWSGRYIAYRGGIRGFTKAVNVLNKAMKV